MWSLLGQMQLLLLLLLPLLVWSQNSSDLAKILDDDDVPIGSDKELSDLVITTALGKIRGTILPSQAGRNFYAFRGIPYAKPPVENLRFKPPEPIEQWFDILDATFDGPKCPQPGLFSDDVSEDCLQLNIYTRELPSEAQPNPKKPVIVFIHPGGFYSLSGQSKNFAGPQYFMDRNLVLVTFNYRLGTLGFLATGTAQAPGNMGLKDQVQLLRWVNSLWRRLQCDHAARLWSGCSGRHSPHGIAHVTGSLPSSHRDEWRRNGPVVAATASNGRGQEAGRLAAVQHGGTQRYVALSARGKLMNDHNYYLNTILSLQLSSI